jgi:hypothetical protein
MFDEDQVEPAISAANKRRRLVLEDSSDEKEEQFSSPPKQARLDETQETNDSGPEDGDSSLPLDTASPLATGGLAQSMPTSSSSQETATIVPTQMTMPSQLAEDDDDMEDNNESN